MARVLSYHRRVSKEPKVPPAGSDAKKPAAPAATTTPARPPPDPRPRAQVAYEGDDEFSVMSTKSGKRKPTVELAPVTPPAAEDPTTEPEGASKTTAWHFIRKIFGQ